jgi:hypothetical protein
MSKSSRGYQWVQIQSMGATWGKHGQTYLYATTSNWCPAYNDLISPYIIILTSPNHEALRFPTDFGCLTPTRCSSVTFIMQKASATAHLKKVYLVDVQNSCCIRRWLDWELDHINHIRQIFWNAPIKDPIPESILFQALYSCTLNPSCTSGAMLWFSVQCGHSAK